jgi:drug/metabolite transporter (DMT)-like permease
MQISRRMAVFYLIIAATLWSTGGLFIKWISWQPMAISGMRSGIAALVLLIYWFVRYKKRIPRPNKTVIFGAINYMILVTLFVTANKLTTSANAILLQFTAPVWLLLIGRVFYKDAIARIDILTVIAVFAGMGLFFMGDLDAGGLIGNFLAIISGITMAIMILNLNKLKVHRPVEIILWGNIMTFIVGIPFYSGIDWYPEAVAGIAFLGIFQLGLAYVFYTSGIQSVTAIEGILIPVIEPLLNPVWVFFGTGEQPSVYGLVGGIIVLTAIIVRNYVLTKRKVQKAST